MGDTTIILYFHTMVTVATILLKFQYKFRRMLEASARSVSKLQSKVAELKVRVLCIVFLHFLFFCSLVSKNNCDSCLFYLAFSFCKNILLMSLLPIF